MKRPASARTIYVPLTLWRRIKIHCVRLGVSISQWLRDLAERELERVEREDSP